MFSSIVLLSPKPLLQQFFLFLICLSAISLVYWPTTTANYAFSDDYYGLWVRLYKADWFRHFLVEGTLQARPLHGFLAACLMSRCKSLSDYSNFHLLGIIETGILAYLVSSFLSKWGWSKTQSCFLALSMCALPAVQVINCWGITVLYFLAPIFALLSVDLLTRQAPSSKGFAISKTNIIHTLSALLLLIFAITIYQPWAMFYWVAVSIFFSYPARSNKERYLYLAKFAIVFCLAALADLLVLRIAVRLFKDEAVSQARTHFATNFAQKIDLFFKGPLLESLNFDSLSINSTSAVVVGLFIILGLWLHFNSQKQDVPSSAAEQAPPRNTHTFLSILIALVFIPLSYLPNLIVSENYFTYRTQLSLSCLILFYTFVSARSFLQIIQERTKLPLSKALTPIIVTASIYNLSLAHSHVIDFFVNPQLYELNLLKAQLRGENGKNKQLSPVYFERKDTTAPFNCHDEFGMPSFACPWVREPGTIVLKYEIEKGML